MPTHVIYPKVSLETSAGKISRWLVAEGETVRAGQILFEIENDKAAVEVEAVADGVIRHLAAEDSDVDVGAPVALIYAMGEVQGQPIANPKTEAAASAIAVTGAVAAPSPHVLMADQATSAPVKAAVSAPMTRAVMADPAVGLRGPRPTPLARRIARDQNLSIDGLSGTGPHGRVQKKDVLAHLASLAQSPERTSPAAAQRGAQTSGEPLHHVWLRRGSGTPLVLLHGFSADLNNWRGLFAGARFDAPVLALDLPCHGQSPLDLPTDIDGFASLVEETIASQIEGPLVLAGHSFGGAVASRIAARGTLDLRGLCLFAPAGLGPEINAAFTDGILRASEPDSLKPWLHELVQDKSVISDAFLRGVVEQRRNQPLTAAMRAFADHFFPLGTQVHSILADLERVTLPTRVVFGRHDRILPFARTADLPGHVALHALNACGHMPHLEHPALSRRLLSEMLRVA